MQRNPSQTPADLALPSRFICSELPPRTHGANLLSVGFFPVYLETAEQILSQCSLSQLLWPPARGFIPRSALAASAAAGLTRGFIPGLLPAHPEPPNLPHRTCPALSPAKIPLFGFPGGKWKWSPLFGFPGGKWKWSTRVAGGGKAALEEPDPGQQRCCSRGFAALKRSKTDWKGQKKLWFCLRELMQTEPKPNKPKHTPAERENLYLG